MIEWNYDLEAAPDSMDLLVSHDTDSPCTVVAIKTSFGDWYVSSEYWADTCGLAISKPYAWAYLPEPAIPRSPQ